MGTVAHVGISSLPAKPPKRVVQRAWVFVPQRLSHELSLSTLALDGRTYPHWYAHARVVRHDLAFPVLFPRFVIESYVYFTEEGIGCQ